MIQALHARDDRMANQAYEKSLEMAGANKGPAWWPTVDRNPAYSPWQPSAVGVSLYGNIAGFHVGFSFAMDQRHNFAGYFSVSGTGGYTYFGNSPLRGVIGWGATLDIYDSNNAAVPVLDDIVGRSYDASAGYTLMGGYAAPVAKETGEIADRGVHKVSLGVGTGFRAGTSSTYRLW